jgi:hypothetical protein
MPLCIQGSRAAGIPDRGLHIGLEAVILHHHVKNMLQLRARRGGCGRCGALLCRRCCGVEVLTGAGVLWCAVGASPQLARMTSRVKVAMTR